MESEAVIAQLSAIAHRTRFGVFRLLVRAGPEGVPAGEIARQMGVPPTTMSTHLGILAKAGLIRPRRESRIIYYGLNTQAVRMLLDVLTADCCQGRPELCGPLSAPVASPVLAD